MTSDAKPTLTRSDFERHLVGLRAWLHGYEYKSYEETMTEFLGNLMEAQSPWADSAILEVLRGDHGEDLQQEALLTVQVGFGADGNSYQRSFLTVCMENDRIELLRSVADMGMPLWLQPLEGCGASATTRAGRWLDTLASSHKRIFTGDGLRDFPSCVDAFSATPVGTALADMLLKHDPAHRGIDQMKGSAGYGIIMEALMHSTIVETPTAEAAPARSRHRRGAL